MPASATSSFLAVRVRPGARVSAVQGQSEGEWRLAIAAPAVDGKANAACLAFLAKTLGIPRAALELTAGKTSRRKRFRVHGLSDAQIADRLAAAAR